MKYASALVFWILSASPIFAQPVTIRTGEHADFTRVVLKIPVGAEWQLGRDASGYVIQMPVPDGYDSRGFFDLIPNDRISAVSQNMETGRLHLAIACDCNANAFLYRPDTVVVDVQDGPPSPQSPFEVMLVAPELQISNAPNTEFVVPRNPLLPILLPPGVAAQRARSPLTSVSGGKIGELAGTVAMEPSTLDADLNALEKAVTENLGRALSQGLLEMDTARREGAYVPDSTVRNALKNAGLQSPGVRASTSMDRNAVPSDPVANVTQEGSRCLPATFFDVGNWGDDRSFQAQIAESRGLLTQEFDRTDDDAVTQLARRYIYFGFGREAEQVFQIDGVRSLERRYLVAIARIIDDLPFEADLFAQQVSCATPVALWALLAHREGPLDAKLNRDAILRSYRELPLALQTHLGPTLARRFITLGDTYGASQVLMMEQSEETRSIAASLAETALTEAMGAPMDAFEALAEIAGNDSRMTAEAMKELLDGSVRFGVELSDDELLLADALRFESAQLPVAGDLAVAQIRALLAMDRFADARRLQQEESNAIGSERISVLSVEYAAQAIERMPDAQFLRFAFEEMTAPLPPSLEENAAHRLLALGFPDRAATLIKENGGPARKYLRARIALAVGDAEMALAELEGVDADQAVDLRRIAQDILNTDAVDGTIEALWRRGAWNAHRQSEDRLLQVAATAVLASEPAELAPDQPLERGRDLLNRSAQSREVLKELLERFAAPEDF